MPNRRSFIRTVTGAAAGLAVSRSFPDADAQERRGGQGRGQAPRASAAVTRREVQIGGRRVRVVDVIRTPQSTRWSPSLRIPSSLATPEGGRLTWNVSRR